ncbi:MAG: hypothetical protein KAJ51_06240 [Thermoplasmata archaeon]|nr:hypothetical protein [Thermoplasmata archaeon]
MNKKIFWCVFIFLILLIATCMPNVNAEKKEQEDKNKDSDLDGIPDYLDNNSTSPSINNTNKTEKSKEESTGRAGGGNWSFEYGSDVQFGAWIESVRWNGSYYIYKASVPFILIDGAQYMIPEDFTFQGMGDISQSKYYLVYHMYSIDIAEVQHDLEILWYFWKATQVNNSAKLGITVMHSAHDTNTHSIIVPFRIDFDILGPWDDVLLSYGTPGWAVQSGETFQFTYNPVDPTWGMKVRQQDYNAYDRWGGIKAWSTNEVNYLLRYHGGEYRGDPTTYLDFENTYGEDDVIWTTARTSGNTALSCGPIIFLH